MIYRAAYLALFLHFLRRIMAKMLVTPDDDRAVCYDAGSGSGTIIVLGRARLGATSEMRGVFKIYSVDELRSTRRQVATSQAVLLGIERMPLGLDHGKLRSLHQAMCVKYNRQEWCNAFVAKVYSKRKK